MFRDFFHDFARFARDFGQLGRYLAHLALSASELGLRARYLAHLARCFGLLARKLCKICLQGIKTLGVTKKKGFSDDFFFLVGKKTFPP